MKRSWVSVRLVSIVLAGVAVGCGDVGNPNTQLPGQTVSSSSSTGSSSGGQTASSSSSSGGGGGQTASSSSGGGAAGAGGEGGMGGVGGFGGSANSSSSGGQTDACKYVCEADPITGATTCSGPITVTSFQSPMMTGQIDMTGFNELEVRFEVCSPTGWAFHLGDSSGNNGWGGDNGSTSNDAEIHLTGTSLFAYRSDSCPADLQLIQEVPNFVSESGCSTRTLILRDANLYSIAPTVDISYPCLLRIHPPIDQEAVPDGQWYWGLNRTVADPSRNGTGTVAASFCLK